MIESMNQCMTKRIDESMNRINAWINESLRRTDRMKYLCSGGKGRRSARVWSIASFPCKAAEGTCVWCCANTSVSKMIGLGMARNACILSQENERIPSRENACILFSRKCMHSVLKKMHAFWLNECMHSVLKKMHAFCLHESMNASTYRGTPVSSSFSSCRARWRRYASM